MQILNCCNSANEKYDCKINLIVVMKAGNLKKPWISQQLNTINDAPSNYAMKDLQHTIDPSNHLPHRSLCRCNLCLKNTRKNDNSDDINYLQSTTLLAKKLFKRILQGLTMSGAKSLKLFIPDLFFVEGDCLEIYQTTKDSRVTKLSGSTPLKHTYATMLRMRRQYKSQLQQIFNKKMYDKVDPERMHTKYYDICVPSHFHPGVTSPFLEGNKNHFKRYILHNDKRYQIQGLQEHKMNDREPFCIIVYKDGTSQLLNQVQLQLFTLQTHSKIQDEILYFQSYIKYKKQADSILYSEYSYSPQSIDLQLESKTQIQVMITLGGLGKYDQGYNDLQSLQEISIQLMLNEPKRYVDLMTYKIVHYLAMASRLYITYLKIKWIINDVGTIYLQEVMQCSVSEIPRRIIRFKLPKNDENVDFYSQKGHFLDMYKDLKRRRALNTLIIKKDIDNKTYEDLLNLMNPQMKQDYDDRKQQEETRKNKSFKLQSVKKQAKYQSRLYNTIDLANSQAIKLRVPKRLKMSNASTYEQHIKQHPQLVMKNMRYDSASLSRYEPQRAEKVDHKINSHFLIHMSTEDKKVLSNLNNKKREEGRKAQSSLDKYIQKRKDRIERSLLYSTFHDLNRQKVVKMNQLFEQERISQKLLENSTKL